MAELECVKFTQAQRLRVIERDGHCCRLCGAWGEVLHVHHVVYRSAGGGHGLGNLISLHPWCHLDEAHGPESGVWRAVFQALLQTGSMLSARALRRQVESA